MNCPSPFIWNLSLCLCRHYWTRDFLLHLIGWMLNDFCNYNPSFLTISYHTSKEKYLYYSQNCRLICVFLGPQQRKDCVRWRKQVTGMRAARFVLRLKKPTRLYSLFHLIGTQPNSLANSQYMEPCHLSQSGEYASQHEICLFQQKSSHTTTIVLLDVRAEKWLQLCSVDWASIFTMWWRLHYLVKSSKMDPLFCCLFYFMGSIFKIWGRDFW